MEDSGKAFGSSLLMEPVVELVGAGRDYHRGQEVVPVLPLPRDVRLREVLSQGLENHRVLLHRIQRLVQGGREVLDLEPALLPPVRFLAHAPAVVFQPQFEFFGNGAGAVGPRSQGCAQMAALVESLGHRDPVILQSMYIFKPPGIGGEVMCHQDSTYIYTEPESCIRFWFALEDATLENGCMQFIPGGHRLPLKKRNYRRADGKLVTAADLGLEPGDGEPGVVFTS